MEMSIEGIPFATLQIPVIGAERELRLKPDIAEPDVALLTESDAAAEVSFAPNVSMAL